MILPFVLLLALGSVQYATGACNECSPASRTMCVSEKKFKLCKDGINPGDPPLVEDEDSEIFHCPGDTHCSDNELICIDTGSPFCVKQCGKCNASRTMCVSETKFKMCKDGINPGDPPLVEDEDSEIFNCPGDTHCSDSELICTDAGSPLCVNQCGKCNARKTFACVSENKYAFCFGQNYPHIIVITCPYGEFCNSDLTGRYCAARAYPTCEDGEEQFPTTTACATTTEDTEELQATASPPRSRNDYCKIRPSGLYPVAGSSCTKYIYCYPVGDSMVGQENTCLPTTVFNPDLQRCVLSTVYPCPPTM